MKYVLLLRGINVGNSIRISMVELVSDFESMGFMNVKSYINSGNIIFESNLKASQIQKLIDKYFKDKHNQHIPMLLKTDKEVIKIAKSIPSSWKNDASEKTDVLYLFEEVNQKETIKKLPIKLEYLNYIYIEGALILNLTRENYYKSQLNKIVGHELYKLITIRNVNTARKLATLVTIK